MKYQAKCPVCNYEVEYESPITDPEKHLPTCEGISVEIGGHEPTKMVKIFVRNSGGFILQGKGWFKKGGY